MVKQKMDALNDGWISVKTDLYPAIGYEHDPFYGPHIIPSCYVWVQTSAEEMFSSRWGGTANGWLDLPAGVRTQDVVAWREFPEKYTPVTKYTEPMIAETNLSAGEKRLLEQYKATKLTPEMIHVLQERSVAMVESNEELAAANEELQKSIEAYSMYGDVEDVEKMQSTVAAIDSMSPYLTTFNMLYEYSGRELIQVFKYSDKNAIMYEYSPKEIQERIRLLKNNM